MHSEARPVPAPVRLAQSSICACFEAALRAEFEVRMIGGADEPRYLPAQAGQAGCQAREAVIHCRADFAPSALHEAAHWLLASPAQRALEDYGLTYVPPPREPAAQARFYAAELAVQALEAWLSKRAGIAFRASGDDPDTSLATLASFDATVQQIAAWYDTPLGGLFVPATARRFAQRLSARLSLDSH